MGRSPRKSPEILKVRIVNAEDAKNAENYFNFSAFSASKGLMFLLFITAQPCFEKAAVMFLKYKRDKHARVFHVRCVALPETDEVFFFLYPRREIKEDDFHHQ
jgi:hypothetical protein